MSEDLAADPGDPVLRMARALVRFNLHPEARLHPSWLPGDWPAAHRRLAGLGPAGRAVLGAQLQRTLPDRFDEDFASPGKRIALLDGPALRRLAWFCGVALHRGVWRERSLGGQLRRQTARFGAGSVGYVERRMPTLPALRADDDALRQRPLATGRVVWRRGGRALQALLAGEGRDTLTRVRIALPRHWASGRLPVLDAAQRAQLDELVRLNILPERLPRWDWLS